ncbi:MAG: hypothetical protein LBJ03_02015 [Holosporales bacterium]|jgi:hypothetical protein|nr:hypothetical protein [Holosporales bacterium]
MFDRFSSALIDSKLCYEHMIKPMIEFKNHIDYYKSAVSDAFMQDFQQFMRMFKIETPAKATASKKGK